MMSKARVLASSLILFFVFFYLELMYRPWMTYRWPLVVATAVVILFTGAAFLLVNSLDSFTSTVKRGLIFYFVGYALFGLTQLVTPLLHATGGLTHWWTAFILMAPTFIAAIGLLLKGTYALCDAFGIASLGTTPWWIETPPPLLLGIVIGLLPHSRVVMPTIAYICLDMFLFWNAHILLLSAYSLLVRIKRLAGTLYTEGLAWLVIAVGVMSVASYGYGIGVAFIGDQRGNLLPLAALSVLMVAGLCLIRSAYAFGSIATKVDISERSVARNFFGKPVTTPPMHAPSSIDIVVYAANQVSIPSAIDTTLDKMRFITSRATEENQTISLSPKDQDTLLNVYLKIEDYLLHGETLRRFTKESLREEIARNLQLTAEVAPQTFWSQLPE